MGYLSQAKALPNNGNISHITGRAAESQLLRSFSENIKENIPLEETEENNKMLY